jgi:hypothetical protein
MDKLAHGSSGNLTIGLARACVVITFCLRNPTMEEGLVRFRKTSIFIVLLLVTTCSLLAADPISGKWSGEWGPNTAERNPVTADLKYDGKILTGSFNSGNNQVTISKGSFNEKTGAVHLEAESTGRGGVAVHYVVEGKLDKGKITGTWKYENGSGDFQISKQ